jgi:penicillin amidase
LAAAGTAGAAGVMAAGASAQVAPVTIIRDTAGVAHVYAATARGLYYGYGYAQAQDRLWQADLYRRIATGTTAEVFGAGDDADGDGVGDNIAADIQSRTLFGSAASRAAVFEAAPEEIRAAIIAYRDGINAWIAEATATGQLPPEYLVQGLTPRAWTTDDTVAITRLLVFQFGADGGLQELATAAGYAELVARLGPEEANRVFADTHVLDDPSSPTTVPEGSTVAGSRAAVPRAPVIFRGMLEAAGWSRALDAAWERGASRVGLGGKQHSNSVAISGRLSASGCPLLLGGPQTGNTTPQTFHEVGLKGPGIDVTGAGIAGAFTPLVGVSGIGHAWTVTSGSSDTVDLYAEVVNPMNPGQYFFAGGVRDFDCRVETILVAGGGVVHVPVCESVHGPIIGAAEGVALSIRFATAGTELQTAASFVEFSRARSLQEFEQAVATFTANFNITYADVAGNIAYWHAGLIPVRAPGANPWVPQLGVGTSEWQGFLPFEARPKAINPEQGYLANWNNKPAPGWANSTAGFGTWGPVARVQSLLGLLEQLGPGSATVATVEQINRLAGVTTCTPVDDAAHNPVAGAFDELMAAVDAKADPRLPEVLAVLDGWNHLAQDGDRDGRYDSPGVAIFNAWWMQLLHAFDDELGAAYDRSSRDNLALRILQAEDAAVPVLGEYLDGSTVSEWASGALVAAVDELTVATGSASPADWLAGAAVIEWAPIGAIGVPDTPWHNRGTYNQIVHLAPGGNFFAENVIAPGQSGNPFSPHFADQLLNYATWTYKAMLLGRDEVVRSAESMTRLMVE